MLPPKVRRKNDYNLTLIWLWALPKIVPQSYCKVDKIEEDRIQVLGKNALFTII